MKFWIYTIAILMIAAAFGCGNLSKPATKTQIDARKAEQDKSADAQRRLRELDAGKPETSNPREWHTSQEPSAPEF